MRFWDEWKLNREGIGALIIIIMLLSIGSAFAGATYASSTVTIAQTTSTVLTTVLSQTTQSYTYTSILTSTFTLNQLVTITGEPKVAISGTAKTNGFGGVGAVANEITFASITSNRTVFNAKINPDGTFGVAINNHDGYKVTINYNTNVPGNLGAGSCYAGSLIVIKDEPPYNMTGWGFTC